jgi:hypothetical protein
MKNYFKLYLITLILVSDFKLFAQPGDDDGGGGLEGDDPLPTPINGNLIVLAFVGIIYVFFLLKKRYYSIK